MNEEKCRIKILGHLERSRSTNRPSKTQKIK
jgi:hypothetical protein